MTIPPLPVSAYAFRRSSIAAIIVDLDAPRWTILDANDAYVAVTNHSREELIGRGTFDAFPETESTTTEGGAANVRGTFEQAIATGRTVRLPAQRYDIVSVSQPGTFEAHHWQMSTSPLVDTDGHVIALLHEVANITAMVQADAERVRLEGDISQRNDTVLEQRRELEVTNQQLQENAIELEAQAEELQATAAQLEERTEEAERAGRAATAAEERLRATFMYAPVAIAVLDGPTHVYTLSNPAYDALVGNRPLIGLSVQQAFPELAGQGIYEILDSVFTDGKRFVATEVPIQLQSPADGALERRVFDFVYEPVRQPDGTVRGIVVVGTDVTAQVQARDRATNAQRQLRTLADAIPTLAWTARPDGYIDWYNARWYEYTGTEPVDMEGWGWQVVHDPLVLPDVLVKWREAIATGHPFEMTFPLRAADGRFRQFLTRVVPIKDGEDQIVRWFGTNTDVDAERRALDAAEAARLVAESANRAKSEFLASMSHELRTPLNAIGGYAELLEIGVRGELTTAQKSDIARIRASQRHLLSLVNDVLNFARLEAGRVEFAIERVSVADLFADVDSLIGPQLAARRMAFSRDHGPPNLAIRADREKARQVLVNLLSNAVKFTNPGGKVSVRAVADGDCVRVMVEDTGSGIPADRLDDIFEPFVQVNRTLSHPSEGTGLGLSISRDLARGMGGDLTVESTVGVGSTFTLTLPVAP